MYRHLLEKSSVLIIHVEFFFFKIYFLLTSDRGANTQQSGALMSYGDSLNAYKRKNTSKGEMKDKTVMSNIINSFFSPE